MPSKPRKGGSRAAEVAFGTAEELPILQRWMKLAGIEASRVIRSRDFDDYDFLILTKTGMPLCYVEVKNRRTPLSKYGDAIAPIRKHHFAVELRDRFRIPFLLVTQYPDALVEVDLADEPAQQKDVTRHDRPGTSVSHGHWEGEQLTVLEEKEAA